MQQEDRLDKKSKETAKIPLKYFAYGFGAVEPMVFSTQSDFFKKIKNGVLRLIHFLKL